VVRTTGWLLGGLAVIAAALGPVSVAAGDAGLFGAGEVTSGPGGSFVIRWATSPAPLPLNEPFELNVDVIVRADIVDDGNPVWLDVDARMPAHAHGMNTRPKVQDLGGGRFVVKGLLFHMAGAWQIRFDVAKGRIREQATMVLELE